MLAGLLLLQLLWLCSVGHASGSSGWVPRHPPALWERCGPSQQCLVVVGIVVHAKSRAARDQLRATILAPQWHARGVVFVFVLARPGHAYPVSMADLDAEFEQHGDMVLLDSEEVENGGSRKSFAWIQFGAAHWQHSVFW